MEVDHVLTLLWCANEATTDGLLLEVHGERVDLERSIGGETYIDELSTLAQELLAELDQAAVLVLMTTRSTPGLVS